MTDRLLPLACAAALLSTGCWGFYDGNRRGNGSGPGNPSVFNGYPTVGSACDVNATSDQCGSASLACTPLLVDGGATCQLPGEFYGCDNSVGCAAGLGCRYGICLESCSTTADCGDPLTVCAPYGNAGDQCLLNECASNDGFGLWQACKASSVQGGDGTCVPLDAAAGQSGCQQAGNVPLGGACQFNREAGGPGFCAVGLICMVEASGDNRGICLSACDAFETEGPACAAGSSCVPTTLPLPPPAVSALEYYSLTGACARSCTPPELGDAGVGDAGAADGGLDDAGACPAPTTCMNGSLTSIADFVCLP